MAVMRCWIKKGLEQQQGVPRAYTQTGE